MKRIVVCFDGTWNGRRGKVATNIERLATLIKGKTHDGTLQIVCYLPGVGTDYALDKYLGGALGFGLERTLLTGYKFISYNYEPDDEDEVFVFGFSRGAFAARSLASWLDFPGLLPPTTRAKEFHDVAHIYAKHCQEVNS